MTIARRDLLTSAGSALLASFFLPLRAAAAVPRLRLTGIELRPVRATSRTVWLFVRLLTDAGLIGLGEPFDAFGFANTTASDIARMRSELERFFAFINGRSPLETEFYRQRGEPLAVRGCSPPQHSARSNRRCGISQAKLSMFRPMYCSAGRSEACCRSTRTSTARPTRARPSAFLRPQNAPSRMDSPRSRPRRSTDSRRRRLRPQRSHVRSTRASTPCAQCAPRLAPPSPS